MWVQNALDSPAPLRDAGGRLGWWARDGPRRAWGAARWLPRWRQGRGLSCRWQPGRADTGIEELTANPDTENGGSALTAVTVTGLVPTLVTLTVCVGLVAPTASVKLSEETLVLTKAPVATAVPFSGT